MRWNIQKFCVVMVMIFTGSLSGCIAGEAATDSLEHALILDALNAIDMNAYQEGMSVFKNLAGLKPSHPVGYFGQAVVYNTIMRNYRVNLYESEYDSLLSLAIERGSESIMTHPEDVTVRLYMGGAYGYRGLFKMRNRDWVGALKDGARGLRILQQTLDLDPGAYDCYYGLGLYHYWRSAKTDVSGGIGLFPNGKKKGIQEIWTAVRLGQYSESSGKYALVYSYFEDNDLEKARLLNLHLLKRFPDDPSAMYMRTRICERLGEWEEALQSATRLLAHLESVPWKSTGYLAECHYRIARAYHYLGDGENRDFHLNRALILAGERDGSREVEGPLEEFDEIVKELHDFSEEVENSGKADQ